MVKNIEFNGESIKISGRPNLYDLFEASYSSSKNLLYGYTEIPEQFTSLLPIIDFIVDEDDLRRYISFMEKIVLDDLYRIPPITFALVGFFHPYNNILNIFRNLSQIYFSTTQWYRWNTKLSIKDRNAILDYIYSFSIYSPSIYKPSLVNMKSPIYHPPIQYLNAPAFGGWQLMNRRSISSREDIPLLLPPNFFGGCGEADRFRRFIEEDLLEERYVDNLEINIPSSIERRLFKSSELFGSREIILPMICVLKNKFSFIFLILRGKVVRRVDSDIYEDDHFVIDFLNRYRGSKFKIYFSLWNLKEYRKGFSMKINLNFQSFLTAFSRMFYEIRYGGKLLYSSASKINIL